jgi:hypothetical protein
VAADAGPEAAPVVTPPVLAHVPSTPLRPEPPDTSAAYDESEYPVHEGDTLESICERYYHSPAYAAALRQYNLGQRKPTAARADGSLVPGQKLYLPSAAVLEQRYPGTAPKPAPAPASSLAPASGTVPAVYRPDATLYYRVQTPESLYTVARRTLDNGERWQEIHRLNPNFQSEQPLPAGTILVMPAGARVPQENQFAFNP